MQNEKAGSGAADFQRVWVVLKTMMLGVITLGLLSSCTSVPKGVQPVSNFELERYLGKWHEVARLDHSFERGLTQVTAEYSMREDGGVKVINKGWNAEDNAEKTAEGKAYFIGDPSLGSLKVSFFGPFYGGYHIAKLDKAYQMALVVGPDLEYAWILSRSAQPSASMCRDYMAEANRLGIDNNSWIHLIKCNEP